MAATWIELEELADEIATVLGVAPEKVGCSRANPKVGRKYTEIILNEAQARRLLVLARNGKEAG